MNLLESYLKKQGRPLGFYTDKASLFQTAEKRKRDEPGVEKDAVEMPPTQIGRALRELAIPWIPAHSPRAKGRVERGFLTAQDRLVNGMRVAGVATLEQANRYLETEFLPWVNATLAVEPASADDAHRPLEKQHDLAAVLSHVESRRVNNDYTIPLDTNIYQIARPDVRTGLRGAAVRVGSVAAGFRDRYLNLAPCAQRPKVPSAKPAKTKPQLKPVQRSEWNKNFDLNKAPKIWQTLESSGAKPKEPL